MKLKFQVREKLTQLLFNFITVMTGQVMIVTQFGGLWEKFSNEYDIYVSGEVMSFCVNVDIGYEQFMELLYAAYGINSIECRIITKAIFVDCAQMLGVPLPKAEVINIKSIFRAFMSMMHGMCNTPNSTINENVYLWMHFFYNFLYYMRIKKLRDS